VSSERAALLAKLAVLERHVLHNRKIVEQQRALIAALQAQGRDTAQSMLLLAKFERALAAFQKELDALQDEINKHG
jgi:hypothetical protein